MIELHNLFDLYQEYKIDRVLVWNAVRRKYCKEYKSTELLDWRLIKIKDYNRFKDAIKSFVSRSYYKDDKEIEKKCIGYYISYNPINWNNVYLDLMNHLIRDYAFYIQFNRLDASPTRRIISVIMKNISKKPLVLIDIETKDKEILNEVINKIEFIEYMSETPNGYHILIPLKKVGEAIFRYKILKEFEGYIEYKRNAGLNITLLMNKLR